MSIEQVARKTLIASFHPTYGSVQHLSFDARSDKCFTRRFPRLRTGYGHRTGILSPVERVAAAWWPAEKHEAQSVSRLPNGLGYSKSNADIYRGKPAVVAGSDEHVHFKASYCGLENGGCSIWLQRAQKNIDRRSW